ncbi:hypothetical protein B7494_g8637 [Chlorociboria aeruginascens]|nr:hypothetical protein B7494_g8637 [Chlorociboria aeruginascens]
MSRPSAADTPLLRVSRPVSACSRCRAAKIKLVRNQDEKMNVQARMTNLQKEKREAALESRVDKLIARLAFARSRKESVAMHDVDDESAEPPDRKDSLATIRAAIHGKAARRREAADVNELVSDFGFLSVNATTLDFESTTTNMTFARLILAAATNDAVPKSMPFQLPPRAVAMSLVQFYLDNVFALLPVFSETALFNALVAVYQEDGRPVTDFEHWLLYLVLAIGSISQSRSSLDAYYADGVAWVSRALNYADKVLIPGYVSQIQALVLLVEYSMLDPHHFDSWHLIGFACRAVVDLGFHQDPPKEQQPDKKTAELRRKVFYCVYSLDRSISMVHARSFSFTDDSTSVAFPSTSISIDPGVTNSPIMGPHSLKTSLLLFQLRRAQSSWYQELFQSSREPLQQASTYIWRTCQEMRQWSESLPDTLPLAFKDFFDLELLYSYVYCLAPSCRVPNVSDYGKTLIFEYSIAYMQKISHFARDHINTAFYTYHDALRVYFIGGQFTAVLSKNQDQLINGILPYAPAAAGSPQPPPLPSHSGADNIDRSLNCITHISETLRIFGQRWNDSKALQSSFEAQSEPLIAALHQRKHQSDVSRQSQSPAGNMQHSLYEQTGGLNPDEWSYMGSVFSSTDTVPRGSDGPANGL